MTKSVEELVQNLQETVSLVSSEWEKIADHPRVSPEQKAAALDWAITLQDGRTPIQELAAEEPNMDMVLRALSILHALTSCGDRARHLQRCLNAGHTVEIPHPKVH